MRLKRPLEQHGFARDALAGTSWRPADRMLSRPRGPVSSPSFRNTAKARCTLRPDCSLPIWRRFRPRTAAYRLQTDDGERLVGQVLSPADVDALCRNLGLDDVPKLDGNAAWGAVMDGRAVLQLADQLQVRKVRVMHDERVELTGFTPGMRERHTAMGLTHEIIAWKLRMFIPTGEAGPAILARLLERHPIVALSDRMAA